MNYKAIHKKLSSGKEDQRLSDTTSLSDDGKILLFITFPLEDTFILCQNHPIEDRKVKMKATPRTVSYGMTAIGFTRGGGGAP